MLLNELVADRSECRWEVDLVRRSDGRVTDFVRKIAFQPLCVVSRDGEEIRHSIFKPEDCIGDPVADIGEVGVSAALDAVIEFVTNDVGLANRIPNERDSRAANRNDKADGEQHDQACRQAATIPESSHVYRRYSRNQAT